MTKLNAIAVLFGSQTGNAEGIARHISLRATQNGFRSFCHPLDDHKLIDLEGSLLVFVTSTTGDGDPPDNSTKFWRWFKRGPKEEIELLSGKPYALLGLGDTNYSNFNEPAKRLDKKLKKLGAVPLFPAAFADDAVGLDQVVDPWMEKLFELLPEEVEVVDEPLPESKVEDVTQAVKVLAIDEGEKAVPLDLAPVPNDLKLTGTARLPLSSLTVSEVSGTSFSSRFPFLVDGSESEDPFSFNANKALPARIVAASCISGKKAIERVLELEISIERINGWSFVPGDAIGIVCPNPDSLVYSLLKRLGLAPLRLFKLIPTTASKGVLPFPLEEPITYYQALKWLVSLHSPPKKAFFRLLAEYTLDESQKFTLMYLASSQGTADVRAMRDKGYTLYDLLAAFPSCSVPFEKLIENLPRLQPRYYSIASSPRNNEAHVFIAFNVVQYQLGNGVTKNGLCTGWLDTLTGSLEPENGATRQFENVVVPIFPKVRNDGMMLTVPENEKPLIMISAGTGITPFFSIIEDLIRKDLGVDLRSEKEVVPEQRGTSHRKTWLIHGCRWSGPDGDFLYEKQLNRALGLGSLTQLTLALSREADKKVYVQDRLIEYSEQVRDWILNQGATVYVCGSLEMSKDVHERLGQVLSQGEANGQEVLQDMMKQKRYIREIW